MASPKPSIIYGGCLCEKIRYKITFPDNYDWTKTGSTCQCSMCRKQTGALFLHGHMIYVSQWEWLPPASAGAGAAAGPAQPFTTFPDGHKAYCAAPESTPTVKRGFCTNCGSFLYWRDEREELVDIMVGTIDKEWLKRYGRVLTDVPRHLWCEDEIEGVTDHLEGERWRFGPDSERMPDK